MGGATNIVGRNENGSISSMAVSSYGRVLTDTALQDQTTPSIILRLTKTLGTFTLDGIQTIDSFVLDVLAGHGVVANDVICLQEHDDTHNIPRFFQASVISVTATTISIDRPLDYAFDPSKILVSKSAKANIANEVGTTADPIIFTLEPKSGKWDITRFIVQIFTAGVMDDGKFGSIAKLTHGITLRLNNSYIYNLFNIKTNGSWSSIAYDSRYLDKPPSGTGYGYTSRITFAGQNKIGVAKRIDSATGDKIELIIPDDLSDFGVDDVYLITAEGHVVLD